MTPKKTVLPDDYDATSDNTPPGFEDTSWREHNARLATARPLVPGHTSTPSKWPGPFYVHTPPSFRGEHGLPKDKEWARAVLPDMRARAARPKQTNGYSASRHMWAVNVNIFVVKSAPENEFKTLKAASLSAEFKTLKVPDPPET